MAKVVGFLPPKYFVRGRLFHFHSFISGLCSRGPEYEFLTYNPLKNMHWTPRLLKSGGA
jgi:hypothetical protein